MLKNNQDTGNNVIVVGGGLVGCESALHLKKKGKNVTIIEMLPEIASDVIFMSRFSLLAALEENKIKTLVNTELMEISDKGVIVKDGDGKKELTADTVVIAAGLERTIRFTTINERLQGDIQNRRRDKSSKIY